MPQINPESLVPRLQGSIADKGLNPLVAPGYGCRVVVFLFFRGSDRLSVLTDRGFARQSRLPGGGEQNGAKTTRLAKARNAG